jgi:hypothetical protein
LTKLSTFINFSHWKNGHSFIFVLIEFSFTQQFINIYTFAVSWVIFQSLFNRNLKIFTIFGETI